MGTVNAFPLTTVVAQEAITSLLFQSTSTTSITLGTDPVTLVTQTGRFYPVGNYIKASSAADEANYMVLKVTSYVDDDLSGILVEQGGSGTFADWIIRATGATIAAYSGTSVTSNTIGSSGTKTFATQSWLSYQVGTRVRAADASAPTVNWMEGVVTSYAAGSLAFTADKSLGSGTLTNWTLSVAGQPGVDGLGTGDVVGPASATADSLARFDGTTGKLLKNGAVVGTDVAGLAVSQAFTKPQGYAEAALTYTSGGTTAWDVDVAPLATLALATGNTTMGAPSNVVAGRVYSIRIVQDSTPRTIAWNAAYKWIGGSANTPVISTGSGAVDRYTFVGRSGGNLEEIGRAQGIA